MSSGRDVRSYPEPVPTLVDLLTDRTGLTAGEADRLHALVAEWQLVSDLSFADLVLWVRDREGSWLAVAHMRPTTGPTIYAQDVVGSTLRTEKAERFERVLRTGRLTDEEPLRGGGRPLRRTTVPVPGGAGRPVAVLSRDANVSVGRAPSPLELAYLTSAGELLQMVSEGTFPFPPQGSDPETAPRVGDGLLRLDRTGHVVYASPNASSACRRLGVTGDLLGAHLEQVVARLPRPPGELDEPRGSAALAAALRLREPRLAEV